MKKKPYKPKIVLGKRQYRTGPTEKTMQLKLNKKKKPTAEQRRVKMVGDKLGS